MFSFVLKKDFKWLLGYVKCNKIIKTNDKEEQGQNDGLEAEMKPIKKMREEIWEHMYMYN